ncbi:MAG: type II secretion system F family protein [Alphaproteobacteria bacterium]|nr:type II secretion system F family protein [Alphaproteobacteria bacterium]
MFNMTDILSFILAFFILYFTLKFLSKLRREDVFKKRLKDLVVYKEHLLQKESQKAYKRSGEESLPFLRKFIDKIQSSGADGKARLKTKFDKAGIKSANAALVYGIAKISMIFLLALIGAYIAFEHTKLILIYKIAIIMFSALLGSYFVDIILRRKINARQERVLKAFPEALDLMVICTEAGLSLTSTIQRVAREISQLSPDLGYELALLSVELNMLPDRRKALQNFSDRLDSPYFKSIISNISQAEQYGTPIAQTMRIVADEFRVNRLIKAEERAAKLPALLSLPMMLFIFPCIYLIILGPAIINVMYYFNKV